MGPNGGSVAMDSGLTDMESSGQQGTAANSGELRRTMANSGSKQQFRVMDKKTVIDNQGCE